MIKSLVENGLDQLMHSQEWQSHIAKVGKRCDELINISMKIEQPSRLVIAKFHKVHLLLTHARLLERDEWKQKMSMGERNREMSFDVGKLYETAFNAAKDISYDPLTSADSQIRKYSTRSVYACARSSRPNYPLVYLGRE